MPEAKEVIVKTLVLAFASFLPVHYVTLDWVRSVTLDVKGHNVYRRMDPKGHFTRINTKLVIGTEFIDRNVKAGAAYYYVITAVGSNGRESAHSNQIKALVPIP